MRKYLVALLAAAMFLAATTAMAVPMSGSINFAGGLQLTTTESGGVTFGNAQGVEFVAPHDVIFTTGDFNVIPLHTPVSMTNFIFSSVATASDVKNLWYLTDGGKAYSFDLSDVAVTRTGTYLGLYGHGMMHADGFDDTLGTWALTTQSSSGIATGQLSFSDNTNTAAPVPEPGTIMLLGVGILGLAVYGKRKMNKEA